MRVLKLTVILFFILFLSACYNGKQSLLPEKLSPKASLQEQEIFKKNVGKQLIEMLEQEYQQPFKIINVTYEYRIKWVDRGCRVIGCPRKQSGVYTFEIQAVDNPIIVITEKVGDVNVKEWMKNFKEDERNLLGKEYCLAFSSYWSKHEYDKDNENLEKAIKFCNDRGQEKLYNPWKFIKTIPDAPN